MENVNNDFRNRTDVEKYRYIAALSYLNPIFLIIMLIIDNKSNYVRYHANQAVCLLLWFAVSGIAFIVPVLGWIAGAAGMIAGVVFSVIAIVRTLKWEYYEIPFIGKYRIVPQA